MDIISRDDNFRCFNDMHDFSHGSVLNIIFLTGIPEGMLLLLDGNSEHVCARMKDNFVFFK